MTTTVIAVPEPGFVLPNGATVIASKRSSAGQARGVRIILAVFPGVQPYVNWRSWVGDDGQWACELGHYFESFEDAVQDYTERR